MSKGFEKIYHVLRNEFPEEKIEAAIRAVMSREEKPRTLEGQIQAVKDSLVISQPASITPPAEVAARKKTAAEERAEKEREAVERTVERWKAFCKRQASLPFNPAKEAEYQEHRKRLVRLM